MNNGNPSGGGPRGPGGKGGGGKPGPKGNGPKGGGPGGNGPKVGPFGIPLNANGQVPYYYRIGRALAGAEYGPTIAQDRHQIGVNDRRGAAAEHLTAGYFDQLGRFAERSQRAERNIATGLSGQLAGIGGQTHSQLNQIDRNAVSGLRSYTPEGTPGDNSLRAPAVNQLVSNIAQQKDLSAQNSRTFRSTGALQGANYRGLAASNLGTNALYGEQQLGGIAQSTRLADESLVGQIAGLRAKRGALAAADAEKVREFGVTSNLTKQGLGLKNKALNITAANDRTNNALTLRAQNLASQWHNAEVKLGLGNLAVAQSNANSHAIEAAASRARAITSGKASGGVKPLSTSVNNTAQGWLDTAASVLGQPLGYKKPDGTKAQRPITVDDLAAGTGSLPHIPDAIGRAAWNLKHYGGITPANLRALHNMGMHNITYRGRPVKVLDPRLLGVHGGTGPQKGFTG